MAASRVLPARLRGRLTPWLRAGLFSLLTAGPAAALDPATPLARQGRDLWLDELPQSSVHAIAQTRDGHLWFGTYEGLVRFDGVAFTVFGARSGLGSDGVWALHADDGGRLWVATLGGGLACLDDGRWTHITTRDGLAHDSVRAIAGDGAGGLWVGSDGGLDHVGRDRRVTAVNNLPPGPVLAVLRDRAGRVWAGTDRSGLFLIEGRAARKPVDGLPMPAVRALAEDAKGRLWVATYGGGLAWLVDGKLAGTLDAKNGLPAPLAYTLLADPAGPVYAGTEGGGLVRIDADGKLDVIDARRGLSHDFVRSLLLDREGSLWIGTNGGLTRLRDTRFENFGQAEGLPSPNVRVVTEDGANGVWIGTDNAGLVHLADGRVTVWTTREGLPANTVRALHLDRRGALWVGTGAGLARIPAHGGKPRVWTRADGLTSDIVYAIVEDRAGAIWVGTINQGGLHRLDRDVVTRVGEAEGMPSRNVRGLLAARDGTLWVATAGDGVFFGRDGRFQHLGRAQGLPSERVFALSEDARGNLWMATGSGLARRAPDGSISFAGTAQGLPANTLFSLLEDAQGDLWASSNVGVLRLPRAAAEAMLSGDAKAAASIEVFRRSDGLGATQCNGSSQPAAWRGRGGRLWFATMGGASVIDPARHQRNPHPPPVALQGVLVDGAPAAVAGGELVMPPGSEALELRWAGLSFLAPEKVRFRFRLTPYDRGWVEAGGERRVRYTHLDPGRYVFEVLAANEDGVWSVAPARVQVELRPQGWQTGWARLLAAVLLALAAAAAVRLRERALARRNRELEDKVAARTTELAQALHEREEKSRQAEEANRALLDKVAELQASHRRADRIFSALAQALPGKVLEGRYRLEDKIGQGGFGAVFRATHLALGRAVAVKVFRPRPGHDSPEDVERFRREGRAAARLVHPHAIAVLDSGVSEDGIAYLAMELLEGHSLSAELLARGRLGVLRAVSTTADVADALAAAHAAGIVHRDVKPDNVYFHRREGQEIVKVLDFGIARLVGEDEGHEQLTQVGSLIGTPGYMAPERLDGHAYDGRADVYALGVTLYGMLTGRSPYGADPSTPAHQLVLQHLQAVPDRPRQHRPELPPELEELVLQMLVKDPAARPSAAAVAERLYDLAAVLPPDPEQPPMPAILPLGGTISSQDTHGALIAQPTTVQE